MELSDNTQAILLLTAYFNSAEQKQFKPLTTNGYGYFACWLNHYKYQPAMLLSQSNFFEIMERWETPDSHKAVKTQATLRGLSKTIAEITSERLEKLLGRGASLSFAMEKWSGAGIWVMDRSHPDYPKVLLNKLKEQAPAILFGVGDSALLKESSIGFVGSRHCTEEDLLATSHYVDTINKLNYQVVSGAADGIDSHAMLASLNNGHHAIGIVPDSLYKKSASQQWRSHIKNRSLVLISPFMPEARWSASNAMARNKYIYLLSKATVVVCSGINKSGTYAGADENLKNQWQPLLVSTHTQPLQEGNQALLTQPSVHPVSLQTTPENWQMLVSSPQQAQNLAAQQQTNLFELPVYQLSMQQQDILTRPLVKAFYQYWQHNHLKGVVCQAQIATLFPEFQFMGQDALTHFLGYLVSNELLQEIEGGQGAYQMSPYNESLIYGMVGR